ncbi:MAG TPA: hypothetical protein GX505_12560 [Clostridiales bacterium]|nr:hypothetical protein [Clostridiales bacterium]
MQDHIADEKSDIGIFFELLRDYRSDHRFELSFLYGEWADFDQWKAIARAKVFDLLSYFPKRAPLLPATTAVSDKEEFIQEEIEFNTALNVRVKGTLLIPGENKGPYPAVIALHDHGGFYFYGREKILQAENEPEVLKAFKRSAYSGRSWANELVKRGYVVLCIDAFYFGSRKTDFDAVSRDILERRPFRLDGIAYGTDEYIEKYNRNCVFFESLLVKHILTSGATWPGILFHDDRRCIDYLYTRDEVDKDRIGCCGLSIGGFRSAHLAALDSRIRCSVAAGWMTTYDSLLYNRLRDHTYMIYIPGLLRYLDLPDVVSMTAPNPLFIQQCSKDMLFTYDGMLQACLKIKEVYKLIGHTDKYSYQFYDNGHEFNAKMQEDAFDWLDKWLK